jgi:uncharacterized protein YeaO (DUF488 family)
MKSLPHVVCLLALAGCAVSNADPTSGVAVDLASVTLSDECGPPPAPPATPPVTPAKPNDQAPAKTAPPGSMVPGAAYRGNCNQTSMQLVIKTPAGMSPTTVKIKRVELLDDKGKLLEVLTTRWPRTWNGATSKYSNWDEKLAAGQSVQAMYDLTTPDWNKLTNGRWNAHTKAFQVRVTVTIGNANKTVEKQSITPARLPPAVPT